jgi:hypothetical protein
MICPKPNEHASRIYDVHEYINSEPALKEHVGDDFDEYMRKYLEKCKRGEYDTVPDVPIYSYRGRSSNGLNMYWRLRGVRAENAHQKMSNMLPACGIGIETAHYLILNLMSRYSVNSGTARCGEHDFGHPWLFYVDIIQDRIEQIWNVTVFSSHTNILAFKPTYFVEVGIGPLSYDSTCVQVEEPMPHLTGDMLFLAQRMKLKCPPIPCSTKEEFKIHNAFLRAHPKQNERQWRELASQFLHKMDGINVFTKLPQMLRSRFDRWSVNQDIKILGERIKDGFNHTRKKLFMARTNAPQPLDGGTMAAATSQRIQPNSTLTPVGFVPPITAPFQTCEIIAPVAS